MKTMKEYETLKIYGNIINRWMVKDEYGYNHTRQLEIEYREYDFNGKLINRGSEDFSMDRYNDQLQGYRIFGWDGKKYNAGRNRWFMELAFAKINRNDLYKLRRFAEIHHGKGQEVLELRSR